ncbi:hypothetical protein OIU74_009489 [Salix koriyanagi]|uniref:Uncharacterized protein n=1 Tax=Salix koriyanagi TaxID=2511006 RepID=A0A9Q0TSE0_9ROSI|nr:hypothetical protein OIU74_009489 [Salix koriyanagi]
MLGPEQMNGDWIEWYQSFHEFIQGKTPCLGVLQIPRHNKKNLMVLFSEMGEEFQSILNLSAGDLVSTKLWFGKKIRIPFARNACSSFDDSSGWDFFELNALLVS